MSLDPRLSTWRYPHLLLGASACRRYRSVAGTQRPQLLIGLRPRSAANPPHVIVYCIFVLVLPSWRINFIVNFWSFIPIPIAAVDRRDRQTDGHPTVTYTLLHIISEYSQSRLSGLRWDLIVSIHLGGASTYPCFIFYVVSKWDSRIVSL